MRVWAGATLTARLPQVGERMVGDSGFKCDSPRVWLWQAQDWLSAEGKKMHSESQRWQLLSRRACRTECRTRRNWLRPAGWGSCGGFAIQEWIFKTWPNADTHPVFVKALADEEAAVRKDFFVLLYGCGSEGRIKQKIAPKDLFRIAENRISFGDAAATYQCFKIGDFYFVFALDMQLFSW